MNLTIKEILTFGWNTTKKNYMNVLFAFALSFLVNSVLQFAIESLGGTNNHNAFLGIVLVLVFVFIDIIFQIGLTKESLVIVRGGEGSIKKTFDHPRLFFKAIFAWLVYGFFLTAIFVAVNIPFMITSFYFKSIVVLIGGFVLSIAVVFVVNAILGFSRTIVVDKETGPVESLKISMTISSGVVKNLIFIFFSFFILNILGFLCLGIGLLVTIPVTYFSTLFVYNSLLLRHLATKA